MSDSKVIVAVRVRPMNRRELDLNTKCIVEMEGNQTLLQPPPANSKQGENRYLHLITVFGPWMNPTLLSMQVSQEKCELCLKYFVVLLKGL
uniref:Kinesin family member 13A n=1 Tax=Leptobrachium leishanense TaxID=445787 RepID=A0A8C5N1U8_9ANUR